MNLKAWVVRLPRRLRSRYERLRCRLEQWLLPGRCLAVFMPFPSHLNFVGDTLLALRARNIRVHCYTTPELVDVLRGDTHWHVVRPLAECRSIPYRVLLTAATHVHPDKYGHPSTQVAHMPHSLVSLHSIFTPSTFTGFDHVLCCGPHHEEEIRAIFRHNGQQGHIHRTGYEVVDRIARSMDSSMVRGARPCVLVAPTWGESGLLYRFGRALVDDLLRDHDVILRPHGWRIEQIAPVLKDLDRDHGASGHFRIDRDPDARASMAAADIMLSDFSGVAFEFALGCQRPVIFMDGPRKNAHLDWRSILDREGVEVFAREQIGMIVPDASAVRSAIAKALQDREEWAVRTRSARERLIFHFGHCAGTAADQVCSVLAGRATR